MQNCITARQRVKRCKSVSIHGIQYKAGDVVQLQCDSLDNASSYSYAAVIEVLVVQEEKIFVIRHLEVKGFKNYSVPSK